MITGAAGQLGTAIARTFAPSNDVVAFTRSDADVRNHAVIMHSATESRPAVIINCAAYNDVDGADTNAMTALAINAKAVRSLARAAEAVDAILVRYSTDFVFDTETDRPNREDDLPSPRSVYGQSKLTGEWLAAATPRHFVLRVESLSGGQQARSSIDRILHLLERGTEATVL